MTEGVALAPSVLFGMPANMRFATVVGALVDVPFMHTVCHGRTVYGIDFQNQRLTIPARHMRSFDIGTPRCCVINPSEGLFSGVYSVSPTGFSGDDFQGGLVWMRR